MKYTLMEACTMTENVTDQITCATPDDQDSAGAERPAAPAGSVYLSDVLARVRQHANDNNWCGTAESVTTQALNEGLSFKLLRRESQGCGDLSCRLCYPGGVAEANVDAADDRFTAVDGTDPFVTKARLKMAIRKAVDLGYNWDEPLRLYRELVDTYQLDAVPLPVLTYTVTFTVTDAQLHGRPADQSGVASALESGTVAGFTVSAESAEEATATLMP
ncbi:hypothetical protein [Actinoplanes aureus]|uniref:Uncharacterized protein n=1 Tax=Actinoplanes aureus TaxID=2792083 RepID=A0A931CM29_9ACTN|nr:hypothetical protein [Actinoplanes aureus]MBG0568788.1 hypothetical protein [Actinoplanes aureus]